jgi:hypothetical protein
VFVCVLQNKLLKYILTSHVIVKSPYTERNFILEKKSSHCVKNYAKKFESKENTKAGWNISVYVEARFLRYSINMFTIH